MNDRYTEWITAAAGSALSWFFGGFDSIIKILLAMTIIEYLTGIMARYSTGRKAVIGGG